MADGRALFLPQRPYLPLGTLADALVYPRAADELPRDRLVEALSAVGLLQLVDRLDEEGNWAQRLSIGERLAFALVLPAPKSRRGISARTSRGNVAYWFGRRPLATDVLCAVIMGLARHDTVVDIGRRPVSQAAVG